MTHEELFNDDTHEDIALQTLDELKVLEAEHGNAELDIIQSDEDIGHEDVDYGLRKDADDDLDQPL